MKFIKTLLLFVTIILTITACSEQHFFTNKENLNNTLNFLSQGQFYSCSLKNTISKKENKNINLIQNKDTIGLIYKKDKWNNGNSIYVRDEKNKNFFNMVDFYFDKDLDIKTLNEGYSLKLNNDNLYLSLFDVKTNSSYKCIELKKILSQAMKKQLLKNFVLQKNSERL